MNEVIADRYELGARLGSGGMADVYAAYDRTLGRTVALKVLRTGLSADRVFVDRFTREARSAASISHPRVVGVLDAGSDEGRHYIAMELVSGGTLKEGIGRDGPLPERRALRIAREIADGVAAAHERGVIHRDIKAQNVLIDDEGYPKVADFGIARTAEDADLTQTAALLGSVQYLSPEQVSGGAVDARADVYSLGVVLYEMLTGFLPFRAESPVQIATQHLREDPVPPRRIRTGIDPATDALVLRAMAKRPEKRFASAAELRDAIDVLLGDTRVVPVPVAAAVQGGSGPRRLVLVAAFAVLAVAIVGLLAARAVSSVAVTGPAPTVAGFTAAPVSPTPATTSTPAASSPSAPAVSPTPAATAAPVATAAPAVIVSTGDPAATVVSFYRLVTERRYGDAAAMWSARMQANYPPATNIDGRFADTRSISADSAVVTSRGLNEATVSVYLTEVTSAGTRHFSGTWYLIRNGGGWLMDAPSLGPA